MNRFFLLNFIFWVLLSSCLAHAQSPEIIKRRLTQTNWMSGCAENGATSGGTVFSISKEGSGFLVNYVYNGKGCTGLPVRILRAAVEFRTANSETVKGAVDFVFEPKSPPEGQPLAYAYVVETGIDGTLVLTHTKFVTKENGKLVGKEPLEKQEPQAWYAVPKGTTIKTLIESRLPLFDRNRFDRLVDETRVRSASMLPYPSLSLKFDSVETTSQAIGFAPDSFARSVNLFLFGNATEFSLVAGKKRGVASLDPKLKRIAVDPQFGEDWKLDGANAQAQAELSITFEVARYLYEFYLQSPAGKGFGPHGRGSSFSESLWGSLTDVEKQDRDLVITKSFERAAIKAEVDALGMAVLLKMGADVTQLRDRLSKRRDLLEARLFGVNLGLATEVSFIDTKEFPELVELYVRDAAVLKFLRQY